MDAALANVMNVLAQMQAAIVRMQNPRKVCYNQIRVTAKLDGERENMAAAHSLSRGKRDVDMTEGSIPRHIINFAFPLLIGNIFQQLYNTVDTWVVGN